MRVMHWYLRLPFGIFAIVTALAYVSVFVFLTRFIGGRAMIVGNVFLFAIAGLLLLARDWSKRAHADV